MKKIVEEETTDEEDSLFMGYDAEYLDLNYSVALPDDKSVIFIISVTKKRRMCRMRTL